jgi:hypothetical protein
MREAVSAVRRPATPIEPLLGASLDRVVDLSQRVLADRLDLFQLESRGWVEEAARSMGLFALGALNLSVGWLALLAAAVVAFDGILPLGPRLAIAGSVQVLVGASIVGWAARRRPRSG